MVLKKFFCIFGIHFWKYTKELHNVAGHPSGRDVIRVLVRECKFCGHREHHLLPRVDRKLNKWESFDHVKKDETVEFEEL